MGRDRYSVTRDVVLTKKVWERIQKIAILNSFKLISMQTMKKVWERRSHAFPTHYTSECDLLW